MPKVKNILKAMTSWRRGKNALLRRRPGVVHVGSRSHGRKLKDKDGRRFKKVFNDAGAMATELEMLKIFADMPWAPPVLDSGSDYITLPFFDPAGRLDLAAAAASEATRLEMARQAVLVLFDIFTRGYAHCDFHAKNLFWIDECLYVIDFEAAQQYPAGSRPAFADSYDICGRGLDSPHGTNNMCWGSDAQSGMSLSRVLGIDSRAALEMLDAALRDELLEASLSFNKQGKRHVCKAGKIYASFELPHFSVAVDNAQRDSSQRWKHFDISPAQINGASILDLGCNAGAQLFCASQHSPSRCVGVEYDQAKVDIANKLAALNGLNDIEFRQADIDSIDGDSLAGPFDIVLCLAIEAHLKQPQRLYPLLSKLCKSTLIFEGNSITDMDAVVEQLKAAGFTRIETLGSCSDDARSENNARELIKAYK